MPSGMQITPLQRTDIPELSRFLINGFGVPATETCFSHDVLSWKYFDGPSGSTETSISSLVARSAGKIVGHIGICLRQFIVSGSTETPISTMHAIDWLGSESHSGSGTFLLLQAFAKSKTQYAVGGSPQAQAVFPRLGFEQKRNIAVFRKVLSPFHRLRSNGRFLRKWAGTAKDVISVLRAPRRRSSQTVELRPASAFTDEIDGLLQRYSLRTVTCQRDHSLLNYFLRYPLAGFTGWTIHTADRMIGYALLMITPHGRIEVGKIVDCWLDTDDPCQWNAAVAAILDRLRDLSADVVTCYGTTPNLQSALIWNSFSESGQTNVYIRDKQQSLPRDLPIGVSMLEADHAIL